MHPGAPLPRLPQSPDHRARLGLPHRPLRSHDASPPAARSYDTTELFGPDTEIEIVHQQVAYRLKITRQGKLILNK